MRRSPVTLSSTLVALGLFSYASVASAQAAAPVPAPAPVDTGNDHDAVVGHFGVGYFGVENIPIANATTGTNIVAPVIGARYWLLPKLGIDGGVGFNASSNGWGFLVHAGLPLALATSHHFTFEITPEATLGFAGNSATGVSYSGFLLDLGARAGAEIQFGFIGIPQLALQASVGIYMQHTSEGVSPNAGGDHSVGNTTLSTSVNGDPWGIFTDNISALYYF